MSNEILPAIIGGTAAVTAAVITPITTIIVNNYNATKSIPKEMHNPIKFNIQGDWKGHLKNEYGNTYNLRFNIKEKRKCINGKIRIEPGNEDKELIFSFWGVSPEDRYFCLHYHNVNLAAGHFGTVFLYLIPGKIPMEMSGQFLGFGPEKQKHFNGTLNLKEAN